MGTTAQVLYPANLAWDGTVPSGGSIERLDDASPGTSVAHTSNFGTGSGEKIMQPQSNNLQGAVADADKKGFALNFFGTDGMDSVAGAERFVHAGDWVFTGAHQGLALTTQTFKVRVRIYRVSADGLTRTLIGGPTDSASAVSNVVNTAWTVTIAMSEVVFEPGETVLISYGLVKNANSAIAEDTNLFVGPTGVGGGVNTITLPAPGIRTQYEETISTVCKVAATVIDGTKTVTGVARDSTGVPVEGATAKLFNQSTDTRVSTYTTAADGAYTFTRADNDTATYYIVGYSDGTHHGTSDRGLTST